MIDDTADQLSKIGTIEVMKWVDASNVSTPAVWAAVVEESPGKSRYNSSAVRISEVIDIRMILIMTIRHWTFLTDTRFKSIYKIDMSSLQSPGLFTTKSALDSLG